MDQTQQALDEWAIIELFGHQKMAGRITPAPFGDMLRVDVPDGTGGVLYTRYLNPKAVYAINPVAQDVAEAVASKLAQPPVARWEMRALLPATDVADDDDSAF